MRYYIGIDPDLHHAGIAVINTVDKTLSLYCPVIPSKFKGEQANVYMACKMADTLNCIARIIGQDIYLDAAAVVESQRIYPGSKVQPNDILMLAQAAGAAVGTLASWIPATKIAIVQPTEWKGTAKKDAFTELLVSHFMSGPNRAEYLGTHASHMLDAAGLAAWGWLRDLLPRSPDRSPDSVLSGSVLNRQRLSRLPSLKLQVVPMPS